MTMRRVALTLIALLTMAALASSAQATTWKRLGSFAGPAIPAGNGKVVAATGDHGLALLGPAGVVRRYDLGPGCHFANVAGGGRAVAECTEVPLGPVHEKVIDLASGDISSLSPSPDAAHELQSELYSVFTEIGKTWVEVELRGDHYAVRKYWNPTSGEVVADQSSGRGVSLDAARPETPLCSPLIRPANPSNGFDTQDLPFGPFVQTGHFGVFIRWPSLDSTVDSVGELYAWRCGQRAPVRVSRCLDAQDSYQGRAAVVGSCKRFDARYGLVAWPADHGVRVMDLRNGRRSLIRGVSKPGASMRVAIGSGDRVYASDGTAVFVARAR